MNPMSDYSDGNQDENGHGGYLTGQLLLAMPAMRDPRFARTVIYMCAHGADGAIGLVVNRLIGSIDFTELLDKLDITPTAVSAGFPSVHFGGPVETGRGFVLHSSDYLQEDSMRVDDDLALTSTVEIVRDIAEGTGPAERLLALGYAGWGPGQLDQEIQDNAWLNVASDHHLVFDADLDFKWDKAVSKIGVDASSLSIEAGRA